MMDRRIGVLLVIAAVGAAAIVIITTAAGDKAGPDRRGLLQHRIEQDGQRLARAGIYIQGTGIAASCVAVRLANPTAPNVAYLRRHFGGPMCIVRESVAPASCPGAVVRRSGKTREVPNLLDLGVYEAQRRALAAGFSYTNSCPGQGSDKAVRPSRLTPLALSRITAQCPAPGTQGPLNVPIALQAEAILPGGSTYTTTAFRESFRAPRCVDGWPR